MRTPLLLFYLVATLGLARGAAAQTYDFPRYADAAAVRADCDRLLVDLKRQVRAIEALPEQGADVLAALDAMAQRSEDTLGPFDLYSSVHPVKAVRDAAVSVGALAVGRRSTVTPPSAAGATRWTTWPASNVQCGWPIAPWSNGWCMARAARSLP